LDKAAAEATELIAAWETKMKLESSMPQISIGEDSAKWLASLELRMPKTETPKVGRPALDTTFQ
jgi:hypothetical protein